MLRLPQFHVDTPRTLDEALAALAEPGARLVAGGTDILPNLKHRLDAPPRLVSLAAIEALRRVEIRDGELVLGAGLTLAQVAEHEHVRAHFPMLAQAAGVVASPLIRNMGTLGGNVNLDTRCRYVNQSEFWRSAIGGCLKSEGSVCHVVPKGRNCVAAMSSDCVPVLIALDATIELRGPAGARTLPLVEYYQADGTRHTTREDGEITVALRVPLPTGPRRTRYVKWSVRRSVDFPLVSLALRLDLARDEPGASLVAVRAVAGVLGAKPRVVGKLDDLAGRALSDPELPDLVAARVHKQCKPLPNVPYDADYRRTLLRVLARRAVAELTRA